MGGGIQKTTNFIESLVDFQGFPLNKADFLKVISLEKKNSNLFQPTSNTPNNQVFFLGQMAGRNNT